MPMVIDSVVFLSSSPPGAAACSLSDMVMWWCMGTYVSWIMLLAKYVWKSFEFWRVLEFLEFGGGGRSVDFARRSASRL